MIYQHTSKKTAMLSLATSHIALLSNQLNHVALPIFMPRFKSIIFIKIALKLSYFCKKMQNFRALGAPAPDPRAFGGWGLCPQTPASGCGGFASRPQPPAAGVSRISGYASRPGLRLQTPKQPPHCEFLATCLLLRVAMDN